MAFQDLLKKQTNNLGKELSEIRQRLLPLVDRDLGSLFIEEANRIIKPILNENIEDLVQKKPDELKPLFAGKDTGQMENLERLADLFAVMADKQSLLPLGNYRASAVNIYQYITSETGTFSFARNAKLAALQQ